MYNHACKLLEIEPPFNERELRKKYHKAALRCHPDKGIKRSDAFQDVHEAYDFLKLHIEEDQYYETEDDWLEALLKAIHHAVERNPSSIKDIWSLCANKIILKDRLEEILKSAWWNIYSSLVEGEWKVHVISSTLSEVYESGIRVVKKYDNTYYVPSWHEVSYFDNVIIINNYKLPKNISIDKNNNIHVKVKNKTSDTIEIELGTKKICLSVDLKKESQIIVLINEGIARIKENPYDNSERSDVFVYVNY